MVPLDSRPTPRRSGATQEHCYLIIADFTYRAITVYGAPFQATSAVILMRRLQVLQPRIPKGIRFGLRPFRSPLLRTSRLISLSCRYLDVSVPDVRSPLGVTVIADGRVSPFGNPGFNAYVQLALAYRSLSRPSSPLCAQASSIRFHSLDVHRCQAENFLRAISRVMQSVCYQTKLNHNWIRHPTITSHFCCQSACSHVTRERRKTENQNRDRCDVSRLATSIEDFHSGQRTRCPYYSSLR